MIYVNYVNQISLGDVVIDDIMIFVVYLDKGLFFVRVKFVVGLGNGLDFLYSNLVIQIE